MGKEGKERTEEGHERERRGGKKREGKTNCKIREKIKEKKIRVDIILHMHEGESR